MQTEIEAEHKSLEVKQALKSNYTKHEQRIAEIMKELSDIASNESTYSREKKLLESMLARVEKTKDSKKKWKFWKKQQKKNKQNMRGGATLLHFTAPELVVQLAPSFF